MPMKTTLTRWDAIVILLCFLLALSPLLWLLRPVEKQAFLVVTDHQSGTEKLYSLSVDQTFTISTNDHTLTVVIEQGRAWVASTDCPDGLCMAGGSISRHGEMLVCAPASLSLTIRGGKEGPTDAIVG
jgi:hypothetical protein